jgi:hypothetical protein
MLTKLADRRGITAINEIDDVLPVVRTHHLQVYPDFRWKKGYSN